jgi:hypothetical protein
MTRKDVKKGFVHFHHKRTVCGGTDLSRGHGGNKQAATWLTKEQYDQSQEFLNKFAAQGSFTE